MEKRSREEKHNITTQNQQLLTFWHSSVKIFCFLAWDHVVYVILYSVEKKKTWILCFHNLKKTFILENLGITESIKKKKLGVPESQLVVLFLSAQALSEMEPLIRLLAQWGSLPPFPSTLTPTHAYVCIFSLSQINK